MNLREKVLATIRVQPHGLTRDGVVAAFNNDESAGKRMHELYKLGLITYTGETRETRTGRRGEIAFAVPMSKYHPDHPIPGDGLPDGETYGNE